MSDQPVVLDWSTSLRVAHPDRVASKGLQGDKILLPQSALGQLLAASTNRAAIPHSFTAFDSFNPYSNRATRPGSSLQHGDSYQQLPHPLMFQLVNKKNGSSVYAGIREFSAEEDEVALSSYLLDALGIKEEDLQDSLTSNNVVDLTEEKDAASEDFGLRILVKAHQLPKGTYVRLRPLEAGYNPGDWKSLLERQLRLSFTTLTKESILSVKGVKGEEFRFLVDKFGPEGEGICVVDTDLEVDIEALNEEQARETVRQIAAKELRAPGTALGSSMDQTIDIWKTVDGQVLAGDYVNYTLPAWDKSRPVSIELTVQDGHDIAFLSVPSPGGNGLLHAIPSSSLPTSRLRQTG